MKIIVVEDNSIDQKRIKNTVHKLTFDRDDIELICFTSLTKELLNLINDLSEPKIFLLDIKLDTALSGIQIAKLIREKDWESRIIFLTNHDKMFEQVYRSVYEVFSFIEKFHNMEERLSRDLSLILRKNFDNRVFEYKSKNADLILFFYDITYIERDKEERKLIIHTSRNRFKINLPLTQTLGLLDNRFRQTHRSCIVNRDRVSKFDWAAGIVTLDTGEKVTLLSKKYKKGVLEDVEIPV